MEKDHQNKKKGRIIIIVFLFFILGLVIGIMSTSFLDIFDKEKTVNTLTGETTDLVRFQHQRESVSGTESGNELLKRSRETETMFIESENLMEESIDDEIVQTGETELLSEAVRIVLDPGHDDVCSRNHPDLGMNEQDINLKIALACRDELNTYVGVEVFMTREDGSCPDNGVGSDDVTGRTAYAESVEADLFVSIHNNATGLGYPSDANGAEVYISVYSAYTDESRKLGEAILARLTTEIGLADRGVLTRIKPEKGYYDDGNVKDWYYLISTSVERGFPGIIIEHAFMDNPHDNAILSDDENLKAMGIADAEGIADYFGLEKK